MGHRTRTGFNLLLPLVLALVVVLSAQEITLRTGAKEVLVPFIVLDEQGTPQSCPAKEALRLRERGRAIPIRGVQATANEPVALAIVLDLDFRNDFTIQYTTQSAVALAGETLRDDDGCVAVNASGHWRDRQDVSDPPEDGPKYPAVRNSRLAEGRKGCLDFLQTLSDITAVWDYRGKTIGAFGYTWAGVQLALRNLDQDPRVRRAVIAFGRGIDLDQRGLPGSVLRRSKELGIPIYAVYPPMDDYSSAAFRAKWAKYATTRYPVEFTPANKQWIALGQKNLRQVTQVTGGRFCEVTEETILPIAKEIVAGLRQQCQLTYEPPADGGPGYRKIEVTISTPGWKVRHRPGYYPDQVAAPAKP